MTKPLWELQLEARRASRPSIPAEMQRIVNLPVMAPVTDERREELSRENVLAGPYEGHCDCDTCKGGPFRLLPDQAAGLHAFLSFDHGPFAALPVGSGKTLLCMLIASHHMTKHPNDKVLVLIPSSIVAQFSRRDLPWARRHVALACSWFVLGNRTAAQRKKLAKRGPGAYVLPYSCLSTTDTEEILRLINPSLIVADEAQSLRGDSAKTKRFWTYVDRRNPTPRGVGMSGTLTSTQPMDYHRMIKWIMGPNCPLPRPVVEAVRISELVRSGAPDPGPSAAAPAKPLLDLASRHGHSFARTTEGIRKAYRFRLHTAPSFVKGSPSECAASIEILNTPADTPGEDLQGLWHDVVNDWKAPCGDILTHGIELHSTLRELSAGFYHKRYWDDEDPLTPRAKQHWEAGQDYYKELRRFFSSTVYTRPGLDTPLLVHNYHTNTGPIGGWEDLYELWSLWQELDHEDLPERLSEPIWVDDYKIRHAVSWAKKAGKRRPGGILWVHHRAVADRLAKALVAEGLPVMRKGSGDVWLHNDGSEKFFCVASISAHGTGKNLQHFCRQILVQWPRPANSCEQLLGRTHRKGQKADRLVVHTNLTMDWDHEQQSCTLADTVYQTETLGGRPKLLIADWNPPPKKEDPEFIRSKYAYQGQTP